MTAENAVCFLAPQNSVFFAIFTQHFCPYCNFEYLASLKHSRKLHASLTWRETNKIKTHAIPFQLYKMKAFTITVAQHTLKVYRLILNRLIDISELFFHIKTAKMIK